MNYPIQNMFNAQMREEIKKLYETPINLGYVDDVTGNACTGDDIAFVEAIFAGSYPKSRFSHFELVMGKIIKDSYGQKSGQHTFTIQTDTGKLLRKGRNLYKYLTLARPRNSAERNESLKEKYQRAGKVRPKNYEGENWLFGEDA